MSTAKLLHRRLVHTGKVIDLSVDRVRLPNDVEVDLEMVRHPGAAAVVPFLTDGPVLLERIIVMVRQYRWAAGGWIHEIPAGRLDGAQTPLACAARELEEETGYKAAHLEPLGTILTTPGFSDEAIHLFLAQDLSPTTQMLERDEVLEVVKLPLGAALEEARRGNIRDAKTLCALFQILIRAEA
ncbi:MAG: NUDIX hydrolase [Acidobacteriota bacterium]